MGRKLRKNTFYGIWDTENECLDSNEAYYDLDGGSGGMRFQKQAAPECGVYRGRLR
nr:MAG TPA: hypothetical protein [Caudoviricetes sp.]